jgi:membrane protein
LSFAIVVALGFLLLVSLVVSAGIEALQGYVAGRIAGDAIWLEWANALFSFALFTLLFAMIYRILPDARIPWRDVWVGAVATSILFVVGKWRSVFISGARRRPPPSARLCRSSS